MRYQLEYVGRVVNANSGTKKMLTNWVYNTQTPCFYIKLINLIFGFSSSTCFRGVESELRMDVCHKIDALGQMEWVMRPRNS